MKAFSAAALLLAIGCAPLPDRAEPAAPAAPDGSCRVEGLSELVGRPATEELGAEALRLSGARSLRWIRPGDAVTMDYREDRLNLHLDGQGRLERADCG